MRNEKLGATAVGAHSLTVRFYFEARQNSPETPTIRAAKRGMERAGDYAGSFVQGSISGNGHSPAATASVRPPAGR